jgi:large subunit ribosomal protein L25
MAETNVLEAVARAGTGKGAARRTRREGLVPGVIYGGGAEPTPISLKFNEVLKALKRGKFLATLYTIRVDGKDERVVCKGVQRDVVRDLPSHLDFQRLTETSRIKLAIPVEFVDHPESPGLKRGGALTITRHDVELWVSAGDIPDHVTVSLKGAEIGDTLKISNVALPAGVKPVIQGRDFAIASITAPTGLAAAGDEEGDEAEEAAEA